MTPGEILADDRATWAAYRATEEDAWQSRGNTFWFDSMMITRARNRRVAPPVDAYVGPYWQVKPYLTGEAVHWFEVEQRPRYTFQAWRELRAAQREAEAEAEREAARTAAVDLLAYGRELQARRGALILEARAAGIAWAEIAEATGLSRQACDALAKHAAAEAEAARWEAEPFDPAEAF